MKNYFYYFSNDEELLRLAKEGKIEEMKIAFERTILQRADKLCQGKCSAFCVYHNILDAARKKDAQVMEYISQQAMKMFADEWYVAPLLAIRESGSMYGRLIPEAKAVLAEYDLYRGEAIKAFARNCKSDKWEEKYNDSVIFYGYKDKLSFVRNGIEYVVYYSDDKYYAAVNSRH